MKTPNGLSEIISTFGDIAKYVRADGTLDTKWEVEKLVAVPIPFSIPLSWDMNTRVSKMRVHKLLAPVITETFNDILASGLDKSITSYGGAFMYRPKRGSAKYSTHSWGIAFDINVATNQMGTRGDMNPALVDLFRKHGWKWGGDWTGANCDPMHFQFCTGY